MGKKKQLVAAALTGWAGVACAQSVTLYGTLDQYLNYMRSDSGASLKTLNDGALLRSRWGLRGSEDLGGGLVAKFQLEQGFSADTGAAADGTRQFDRQAWVGLGSPAWGEVRLGRQNTAIFFRGDYVDYTARTLGSVVNAFGVPSRYNNDIAYISPRWAGVQVEGHFALAEVDGFGDQAVYQAAIDYLAGPVRVGYAGLIGKAPDGAAFSEDVKYHNFYANFDYGRGKIYGVFVRTNNSTSSGAGAALINNGGSILGGVGGVVAGTNADVNRDYDIFQISADFLVTPALRVGMLYGKIKDKSGSGRDADGGSIGAYYALSKRTTLHASIETLTNDDNAGFRPAGSAAVNPNFTQSVDVNGRGISGVHAGVVHRF
ncbi:porin [Methylibium sp.]|uniref:porin n=1 Tax=Methylibium sp. TaxID=2067992 RepID=UPI002DBF6AC5|nr:porin [Methylibium sp.]